jgi:hypothetical protein
VMDKNDKSGNNVHYRESSVQVRVLLTPQTTLKKQTQL